MKIIRPYAKIIAPWAFDLGIPLNEAINEEMEADEAIGRDALRFIEWCARISHRAEDKQTMDSYKRFIQTVVLEHGDWSVVEHVSVSVDAVVDRGITHEWVRHRLFSYTQESTRFVNYEKKMPPSFIYPQIGIECPTCLDGVNEVKFNLPSQEWKHLVNNEFKGCAYHPQWLFAIESCETQYRELVRQGWRPQEARSVFPNALASRIISTTNLRCWRHMLIMRTSAEAHPQMRQVTIPLLKEFQETFPILFDDIVPNEKQAIAMRKAQ